MGAYRIEKGRAVRRATAPVTTCDDCGACCRHMGTPPGYAAYYPLSGEPGPWAIESPNYERWRNMPPAVEAELRAYYDGVKAGTLFDRSHGEVEAGKAAELIAAGKLSLAAKHLKNAASVPIPCLWYDEDAKRCRHYEHRPETCRDPEVMSPGNAACLATRKAFRVPLPMA